MVTRALSISLLHRSTSYLSQLSKYINPTLLPCLCIHLQTHPISTPHPCIPPLRLLITSCSSIFDCHIIHSILIKRGNYNDGFIGDQLVRAYAKFGGVNHAVQLFDEIPNKDLISWNSIISLFSRNGDVDKSFSLFCRMRKETGMKPNEVTLISVIPVCAERRALNEGKCLHVYAVKLGFGSETVVVNSLITMYGMCCSVEASCQLFEGASSKSLVSWNSIIAVYVQNGFGEKGITCFNSLRTEGVHPDQATIVTLLQAFGNLAAIRPGRDIHGYVIGSGFNFDVPVATAVISVYSKCGSLDDSYKLFVEMHNPDRIAWTAMLAGYAIHGRGREAIQCFDVMVKEDVHPDHVIFTHLLNACSHSGLIKEGKAYFESMPKVYGVTPRIDHYSCMVDLLGRSGLLEEAYILIKNMPIEPNAGVWGAFIGACRVARNIEFGKDVAERLFELEPSDPRNYIILSNMYAAAGQWKEASKVRSLMKEMGLAKDPGCSFIEHGGQVHSFVTGDQSHPCSTEIYAKLKELIVKIRKAGYVPNTEFVLHDVEEEVKEDMLYKHSEKLAIAFGVLVSGAGMPITITKNLRICGDCHSAVKCISLIEMRTIIVRDSKRFHHFANGLCSCGDYW